MTRLFFATAVLLLGTTIAQADTLAITNARILTAGPQGEIASGTIVVTNGKISAVGASVQVPSGATVIDAGGKTVTPGLYAAGSNLGAVEIDQVDETSDNSSCSSAIKVESLSIQKSESFKVAYVISCSYANWLRRGVLEGSLPWIPTKETLIYLWSCTSISRSSFASIMEVS
jgi:formylmethanofuran dehydrogenase subunit A